MMKLPSRLCFCPGTFAILSFFGSENRNKLNWILFEKKNNAEEQN